LRADGVVFIKVERIDRPEEAEQIYKAVYAKLDSLSIGKEKKEKIRDILEDYEIVQWKPPKLETLVRKTKKQLDEYLQDLKPRLIKF
jgi:hypothetical protein